jgi:hypothetical protein
MHHPVNHSEVGNSRSCQLVLSLLSVPPGMNQLTVSRVMVLVQWLTINYVFVGTPGTPTYKPQVKTSCRVCIHTLSHALWLQTSPSIWGRLRCCHVYYGSRPRLSVEVDSDVATCPMTVDPASQLRWVPVLPRVIWLRISPLGWGGLRCCHVSYDSRPLDSGGLRHYHISYVSRPRLPAGAGSGAATCPTTL